jgi:hypothetical protein
MECRNYCRGHAGLHRHKIGESAKFEAAGVKLDADGGYRVNDVGVGIAFVTGPWGTCIELNERPGAVYLP